VLPHCKRLGSHHKDKSEKKRNVKKEIGGGGLGVGKGREKTDRQTYKQIN